MPTVYVYVEGSDLEECEDTLVSAFGQLAANWSHLGARLVNRQYLRSPNMRADDLADWDLGINLPIESFGAAQAGELIPFAKSLGMLTGRELVVGIASDTGITDDLVFLGSEAGERELQVLREHVAGL